MKTNSNPHGIEFDIFAASKLSKMSDKQKIKAYIGYGFLQDEAEMMVRGSTTVDCHDRLGVIYYCGNVPWVQAVSKEHAEKLNYFALKEHVDAIAQ